MIHKYEKFGNYIVLDINSGSVHVVDELTYKLLDCFENGEINWTRTETLTKEYEKLEIAEAYSEIKSLKKMGYLFSEDWHEEIADDWNKESKIKAVCLHIAHDCNLRCEYCFANKGDYNGPKGCMSAQVGKKAIDFVIKSSGMRKNIEIDFFGGEPLVNFEVVREVLEYAREQGKKHSKDFRFTMTTNGLLLDDEKLEYINKNMSNLVLSIDGRPEVNDRVRKLPGGQGSYDKIIDKLIKAAQSRQQDNYYVRGTYTSYNKDFANDVLHLADLGFKQISIEPVVANESADYALREEDLPQLMDEYDRLAEEMKKRNEQGRGFNFFHFMIDLTGGPCAIKRISGCGAGHEYIAVTPEGGIYPCHQFAGQEEYKIGNVLEGFIDQEACEEFSGINIYTKKECKSCWARFYCSGGCPASSAKYAGGFEKPYKIACELEKKRVECAIALKVIQNQ